MTEIEGERVGFVFGKVRVQVAFIEVDPVLDGFHSSSIQPTSVRVSL